MAKEKIDVWGLPCVGDGDPQRGVGMFSTGVWVLLWGSGCGDFLAAYGMPALLIGHSLCGQEIHLPAGSQGPGKAWAARMCLPGATIVFPRLTLPVGNTHYGGHGGPWHGSVETGGLVPTAQLRSSSSSPDSREMQRKMGLQTPAGMRGKPGGWDGSRVSGVPGLAQSRRGVAPGRGISGMQSGVSRWGAGLREPGVQAGV